MIKVICFILFFSFIILLIGSLIKALIVLKVDHKDINKENLEDYVEQLELIKIFQQLEERDRETLFRVSRNPFNFTPVTWVLVKYFLSVFFVLLAFLTYGVFEEILVSGVCIVAAAFAFFYPTSHYKNIIKDRERSWNKMYSHVWRLSNMLDDYDPKKTCINMRDYFEKIGEDELALGFEAFYEMWPENQDEIPNTLEEFNRYFPFEVPKDLYYVLLECWRNNATANDRLEAFRKNCELRYEKFSNELLSKVPSKATMLSLPFLMISVMAAILFPALLKIMEAMGS